MRMNLAVISVCALVLAVAVSCVSRLNVGVLAVALAWIVGVYIGGMPVSSVMAGFPSQLFLTLTGVTLLFALAQCNGTLERITHQAVRLCRGNRGTIPVMFFVLGAALSSMGPGNIATAALLAPLAMATAARTGIPLFLMAIMVGNGSNSGALSPFAPTGIIVNGLMDRNGLAGHELQTYAYNLIAHAVVAFGGYALFGGIKLFGARRAVAPTVRLKPENTVRLKPDTTGAPGPSAVSSSATPVGSGFSRTEEAPVGSGFSRTEEAPVASGFSRTEEAPVASGFSRTEEAPVASGFSRGEEAPVASGFSRTEEAPEAERPFERRHWITIGVIAALIVSVIVANVNVGMGAFLGSVVLVLTRSADDGEAMKRMPWRVIVMVCGVTVLISLVEKAQGIDLLVSLVAKIATAGTVTGVVALLTGIVSVYSSTSGVVLPAFLPMVPGLADALPGASAVGIAMSMNIGGHLVDVSPLSTIGALCMAGAAGDESRALFNQLLAWGLSMCLVGAALCLLLF
jgi:di/tricarboxylate transporter